MGINVLKCRFYNVCDCVHRVHKLRISVEYCPHRCEFVVDKIDFLSNEIKRLDCLEPSLFILFT